MLLKDKMNDKNNKNKEIENQTSYSKLNLKTVSIFQNDTQAVFVFKKTERLTLGNLLAHEFPIRQ